MDTQEIIELLETTDMYYIRNGGIVSIKHKSNKHYYKISNYMNDMLYFDKFVGGVHIQALKYIFYTNTELIDERNDKLKILLNS